MKSRRGFTLIEILVALALITTVALLTLSIFGQGLSLYSMETRSANDQANMRQILSDITNRVRLAPAASVAYANGVLSVNGTRYQYDSAGSKMLRDGAVLARGIRAFSVELKDGLLGLSITGSGGKTVSTSLSLE